MWRRWGLDNQQYISRHKSLRPEKSWWHCEEERLKHLKAFRQKMAKREHKAYPIMHGVKKADREVFLPPLVISELEITQWHGHYIQNRQKMLVTQRPAVLLHSISFHRMILSAWRHSISTDVSGCLLREEVESLNALRFSWGKVSGWNGVFCHLPKECAGDFVIALQISASINLWWLIIEFAMNVVRKPKLKALPRWCQISPIAYLPLRMLLGCGLVYKFKFA